MVRTTGNHTAQAFSCSNQGFENRCSQSAEPFSQSHRLAGLAVMVALTISSSVGCQNGGRSFNPFAGYGSPRIAAPGTNSFQTGQASGITGGNATQSSTPAIGSGVSQPQANPDPYYSSSRTNSTTGSGSVPATNTSYGNGNGSSGQYLPPSRSTTGTSNGGNTGYNSTAPYGATNQRSTTGSVPANPASNGGRWHPVDPQQRNGMYQAPTTNNSSQLSSQDVANIGSASQFQSNGVNANGNPMVDPAVNPATYNEQVISESKTSRLGSGSAFPSGGMPVNDATMNAAASFNAAGYDAAAYDNSGNNEAANASQQQLANDAVTGKTLSPPQRFVVPEDAQPLAPASGPQFMSSAQNMDPSQYANGNAVPTNISAANGSRMGAIFTSPPLLSQTGAPSSRVVGVATTLPQATTVGSSNAAASQSSNITSGQLATTMPAANGWSSR